MSTRCLVKSLLVVFSIFSCLPVSAADLRATAEAYLDTIRQDKWPEMTALLADGAHYQDFSMEFFGVPMIDLHGPKAIVGFWRESAEGAGTIEVRFEFDESFAAGPNLFLIGKTYVRNKGDAWGLPGHELSTLFPQITHLRIVDGKVTYHADHVDYSNAGRQFEQQSKEIVAKEGKGKILRWQNSVPESDVRKVAEAYLEAIDDKDWKRMATFFASDGRYQDFTAEAFGEPMIDLRGGAAIAGFWKESYEASGILAMRFERIRDFIAGPNLFMIGKAHVKAKGDAWGLPGQEVEVETRHLMHLRIDDGKVTYHADHVDYVDMLKQAQQQAAASE